MNIVLDAAMLSMLLVIEFRGRGIFEVAKIVALELWLALTKIGNHIFLYMRSYME